MHSPNLENIYNIYYRERAKIFTIQNLYPSISYTLRLRYTNIQKISDQQITYNSGNTSGRVAENIWEHVKLWVKKMSVKTSK